MYVTLFWIWLMTTMTPMRMLNVERIARAAWKPTFIVSCIVIPENNYRISNCAIYFYLRYCRFLVDRLTVLRAGEGEQRKKNQRIKIKMHHFGHCLILLLNPTNVFRGKFSLCTIYKHEL